MPGRGRPRGDAIVAKRKVAEKPATRARSSRNCKKAKQPEHEVDNEVEIVQLSGMSEPQESGDMHGRTDKALVPLPEDIIDFDRVWEGKNMASICPARNG